MRTATLVAVLTTLLSAAGLAWLGFDATGAEEAKARLRTRDNLLADEIALSESAGAALNEADLAAESWDAGAPPPELAGDLFLVDRDGRILLPELASYPALPPPAPQDVEIVRRCLAAARAAADPDPLKALVFVEPELGEFPHPDLAASLADAAAGYYLAGGRPDRALFLSRQIVTELPGARDLDGEAVAPRAHLRILRILADTGEDRERHRAARDFASRLVDGAFGLGRYERDLLIERAASDCEGGTLPPDLARRRSLLDTVRWRILPEAGGLFTGPPSTRWRHQVLPGPEVYGYRVLTVRGTAHLFGYRLGSLADRLESTAKEIAAAQHARIELGTAPFFACGPSPGPGAISHGATLGGELHAIPVRIALPPPAGLGLLRGLHLAMTAAFALSLAAGIFFSARAVRREIEFARVRQHLVDNVSHELRTPLTTIRMHAEMLAEEELPEPTRRQYLSLIHVESVRLSRLVEDVLDLSRLARGEAGAITEAVAAADLAAAAVAAAAPDRKDEIAIAVPKEVPDLRADRESACRALANLVANALRYGGRKGGIRVSAAREGDRVVLTVEDHGPGVEAEALAHLFDRFYRAPRDARRVKGAGLGLTLAREIARAQGGDVYLVRTSAAGSAFALALPVAPGTAG